MKAYELRRKGKYIGTVPINEMKIAQIEKNITRVFGTGLEKTIVEGTIDELINKINISLEEVTKKMDKEKEEAMVYYRQIAKLEEELKPITDSFKEHFEFYKALQDSVTRIERHIGEE